MKLLFHLALAILICALFGPWVCIAFGIAVAIVDMEGA